jgi:hypothetical protein
MKHFGLPDSQIIKREARKCRAILDDDGNLLPEVRALIHPVIEHYRGFDERVAALYVVALSERVQEMIDYYLN